MEIASLYTETDNREGAIIHLKKAEDIAVLLNIDTKLVTVYLDMANVYKSMADYESALICYEKLFKVSSKLYSKELDTKINGLNSELLKEKEAEIERLKNVELKSAYNTIEIKNKEILDSINYAKRIQYALLANNQLISDHLKQHFIFFKPKDIVSGDFYWATKINNLFFLAICDSTGHGVPGAFMSLLNIGFLNEAVKEKNIYKPNEILNYVRKRLIESISNDGQKDGMDALLLCFDETSGVINYAAANNEPLLVSAKGAVESPRDKMPVGLGENTNSFMLYEIPYQKGDTLYLYTDGFADQFGGPKGKKFKYKPLTELLYANAHLPMEEQKTLLENTLTNWQGALEQVDDVCLIGVKL